MQITAQSTLSIPSNSALQGRRECALWWNLHLGLKNNSAPDLFLLYALGCSIGGRRPFTKWKKALSKCILWSLSRCSICGRMRRNMGHIRQWEREVSVERESYALSLLVLGPIWYFLYVWRNINDFKVAKKREGPNTSIQLDEFRPLCWQELFQVVAKLPPLLCVSAEREEQQRL